MTGRAFAIAAPASLTLAALTLAAAPTGPALAQTTSQVTRPIEIQIRVKDDAPRCEPTELRVPADANLDLRIENRGTRSVVVRSADLFRKGEVRSIANTTEQASDTYSVPAGGQTAEILVKSPPAGEYGLTCSDSNGQNTQSVKLVTAR